MRIGAHVSAAGKLELALDRAEEIGAEAVQIFLSGPQAWRVREYPAKETDAYKVKSRETGIGPTFFHGVYLINLATPNLENLAKGVESLVKYQNAAAAIECQGTIFHVGSHRGASFEAVLPQVVSAFHEVLEATPEGPWLIIENSAGMGHSIGSSFQEIGRMLGEVGSDRVRVCLDTQHSFANGYNVATQEGLDATMEEFEREIGLDKLVAVHANDSKCPLDGGIDRHENIGEGHIGREGFEMIMQHPAFADVPFLLEVPGPDKKGPDRQNVDLLKEMRAG